MICLKYSDGIACEWATGWVYCELAECGLGRAGQAESGLVTRESALFHAKRLASLAEFFSALAGNLFAG